MRKYTHYLYLFFILTIVGCKEIEVAPTKSPDAHQSVHLALGNPSNATTEVSMHDNFLLERPQYVLSYSRDRGTPNWVSWHLSNDWIGTADRQDDFRADAELPAGWYRVGASAYTGSGFDRGHNTPSADRTRTAEDNSSTFLMTNMIPQAPKHNRETWASLENYTRDLVEDGMEVYVIMGSYGAGGVGSNGAASTIDKGRVSVPSNVWKVIVVLPKGSGDLGRITVNTRVIAVNTPNSNAIDSDWGVYRTSVDAIERETGYDLLSALPDAIENVLEARVDNGPTR